MQRDKLMVAPSPEPQPGRNSFASLLRFAGLVACVFVTGGPAVVAGGESIGSFWTQQQQPVAEPKPAEPHLVRPRHKKIATAPAPAAVPTVTPTFFVAVL